MLRRLLGVVLGWGLSLIMGATPVFAQGSDACTTGVVEGVVTIGWIECLIGNLLKFIPPLVIIAAIFMIILGGTKLILGGEDPKAYQEGMNTVLFAVIGILALGFIWFVLVAIQQFTGAPVTELKIGI